MPVVVDMLAAPGALTCPAAAMPVVVDMLAAPGALTCPAASIPVVVAIEDVDP